MTREQINITGPNGKCAIYSTDPFFSATDVAIIQGKLNSDTVGAAANIKAFMLEQGTTRRTQHLNASAAKVKATVWYWRVRKDANGTNPYNLYLQGMGNNTGIIPDDIGATPYMSPTFCQYFKLSKPRTYNLEQGQSFTTVLRVRPGRINSDKYLNNSIVAGNSGVFVRYVGDLAIDTVTKQVTTAVTHMVHLTQLDYKWRQLADNSSYASFGNQAGITSVTAANVKVANADTGSAIQQSAGDMN